MTTRTTMITTKTMRTAMKMTTRMFTFLEVITN